ncbi:A/G-specific adenine glycosylase [Aquicella lusitana]|uniref:Adenine DNA glycosylase n=2 Tax=Aquicella lusitana TaxID=254246 RepID=A0A370GZK0_9COXI|nr:A/G-specific DNA-adenine glycosylase [Aquicella lusitana]VVC73923.1 A/G-specific adenine glycosylase [Aquicella lusitana]
MLQQTQVNTVIPYYERFMQQFPDLRSLAQAQEDEVLHLWAGLGYYSRARNLHRAAKTIMEKFKGQFPDTPLALESLPGIGQSTAGAILALAFHHRAPILDGNVKRVLARFHGITTPVNEKSTESQLWELAEKHTPAKRIADYTQAIMDLGATLCTRSKPQCGRCPLMKNCSAHQQGIVDVLPIKKAVRALPVRTATFLVFKQDNCVLLQKRPPTGIWGSLWSMPEIEGKPDFERIRRFSQRQFKLTTFHHQPLESFRHTFSHYHLDIFPVIIPVKKIATKAARARQQGMEEMPQIWYNPHQPEPLGLPKPVERILRMMP